jgi:iron complex transport system substrate-binding protein
MQSLHAGTAPIDSACEAKPAAGESVKRWLATPLVLFSLLGVAFAQQTLVDDRGVAVSMPDTPRRIVTLMPSLTESVCALGACSLLVGTDRFSNWPASVTRLPKLGGVDDAQVETIVALKPDVVLASASARVSERLEALGFKVVVLQTRNRGDLKHTLHLLAQMLNVQAQEDRIWDDIERQTLAAARRVPTALLGKRVYFEVDSTPYAAGASSFVGETLTRLGLSNVVPAALGPFPKLNPEFVVRSQPDIIMAIRHDLNNMSQRPGWSTLTALQRGQTCGFQTDRYELLIRPGPRMGEAANALADCLVLIAKGP